MPGGDADARVLVRRSALGGAADHGYEVNFAPLGQTPLCIDRIVDGNPETYASDARPPPPGPRWRMRVRITGTNPTRLLAKVWTDGDAEPAEWLLEALDDGAPLVLRGPGRVAVAADEGGEVEVDDFVAFDAAAVAEDAPLPPLP